MRIRLARTASVVFAALVMVATPIPAMATVSTAFTSSAEGWKVFQETIQVSLNTTTAPTFSASGGNPDGYISVADLDSTPTAFTGFESGNNASFGWLDNHSENNGGTLSFDLRTTATGGFGPVPQLLSDGHGHLLPANINLLAPPATTNAWTPYSVPLTAASNVWEYCPPSGSCVAATQDHILEVLTYLFRVVIVADTNSASGEVVDLDNPAITGGTPPPDADGDGIGDSIDACPTEVSSFRSEATDGCPVTMSLTNRFRRKTFSGKLTATAGAVVNDPCQEGRTVTIYRKKRGPDQPVVTALTVDDDPATVDVNESGTWAVRRRAKQGKYYARVEANVLTVQGDPHGCAAATSNTVRVR